MAIFITGMWLVVLAVVAFLVAFVTPIDGTLTKANFSRFEISIIQAGIAVVAVLAAILVLSRMKRLYLRIKLRN